MSVFRFLAILLLVGLPAKGAALLQATAPPAGASSSGLSPEHAHLLRRVREKMAGNLARLPNYTCLQTIERTHRDARKKRFERLDLVRVEVALVEGRELFAWPGAQRIEEAELGKMIGSGPSGNGNFALFARTIFLTDAPEFTYLGETQLEGRRAEQFGYRVLRGVGEYRIKANEREATVGYHGAFWADARTLDLLRLEVNADDIPPALGLSHAVDLIDYAPTRIGDSDFLLAMDSSISMQDLDGSENRNHATLGKCRQFRGDSVVSFDDNAPSASVEIASRPAPSKIPLALPEAFTVYGSLETPLDGASMAVGDPISIRLSDAIKTKGKTWVPKGATVHGRIVRAEHAGGLLLLRLNFETLDFENGQADLKDRAIRCRVADSVAPNSTFRGEDDAGVMVFAAANLRLARGFRFILIGEAANAARTQTEKQGSVMPQKEPARQGPPQDSPATAAHRTPESHEPLVRAEATAIVVDAIVTDRKGRHVPGLTAGDFQLFEDSIPQTVTTFTPPALQAKRKELREVRDTTAAAVKNQPTAEGPERTPQLITLLIDLGDLHSDGLARSCAAASRFAQKTIAAGNLISIYWIDSSLHLGTPFTRDEKQITAGIAKVAARVPAGPFTVYERESAENELDFMRHQSGSIATPPGRGAAPPPDGMAEAGNVLRSWITTANALQARAVFVALRAMALAYRGLPGRKTVVLLSEGFLHAFNETASMQAVIDAANRANVAIYVIDAAGLSVNAPDRADKNNNSAQKATYDRPNSSPDLGGIRDRAAAGMNQFDWLQTMGSDRHSDLGWIADATGGFLKQDSNDLESAFDRVEDDAGAYYTLVYSPSNHNYDGGYRTIKLELAHRGLRVRYRRGYWAFPPGREVLMTPAAAQLLATVESGERKSSFSPELNTAVVAVGGGFGVASAVSMPGQLVRFEKLLGQYEAAVSVLLLARDDQGGLVAVRENYGHLAFSPPERDQFSSKLFNWQGHLLFPERKVATLQAIVRFGDGTFGVSDRKRVDWAPEIAGLQVTDLVLANQAESSPCTPAAVDPLCVQGQRLMLPAARRFPRTSTIQAYCSIYGVPGPNFKMRFDFQMGSVSIAPKRLTVVPGSAPQVSLVLASFDLQALEPGDYVLEMNGEDQATRARVTQRASLTVE